MRDVLVVPETKTVLDLIRDFQQRRRQMAIVVDEYGSTVGLVTAEDAIEQLTGELEDEFGMPRVTVQVGPRGLISSLMIWTLRLVALADLVIAVLTVVTPSLLT